VFSDEFNKPVNSFKAGFESLLKNTNLLHDNHGEKRSIYSLRHTYGTFRVIYGKNTDIFLLAENMGTSVEMIKKHYYHGNPAQVADKITK